MRIPITSEGTSIIAVLTVILAIAGWAGSLLTPWFWIVPGVVWLWVVSFFRDPARQIPRQPNILYAPADGKITEVTELAHHERIDGPCVRIRIFLSIFNVHINRMPCAATIRTVEFRPGRFLNALRSESADVNESNTLILDPKAPWTGPIVVRQIAGAIARTIVCRVRSGEALGSGERFGMIKFGSGTELIVPQQSGLRICCRVGDRVYGGLTPLVETSK